MPLNSRDLSEKIPEHKLGSLGSCLVEGDPEQRRGERRVRRRSLVISILVQAAVIALLVLLPLFGKSERLSLASAYIPIPPYGHLHRAAGPARPIPGHHVNFGDRVAFFSPNARPAQPSNSEESEVGPPEIGPQGKEADNGPECSWCIHIGGRDSGPRPPQPTSEAKPKPQVLRMTTIDPAMLVYRVEPVYPFLAKQIHKEGRVELHARIATDGSIRSLEVVSGDPAFYQSAVDAVSQWHYRPTMLNGQPVEIDTHITVIYTMSH
ncbi:MAG: hypothetical protein DMG38_03620 [Acidobacteria bacterium]|nr:MAG: hypothetical protein DMG38_03620 [Acidobacteriota bacterium]